MYKVATREKYRFLSHRGLLTTEDLWDLSLTDLNTIAKGLNKQLKEAKEEDFLSTQTTEDIVLKKRFDIVLDILNTKKAEQEAARKAAEDREHNQKILAKIAQVEERELDKMDIEDLRKQLR